MSQIPLLMILFSKHFPILTTPIKCHHCLRILYLLKMRNNETLLLQLYKNSTRWCFGCSAVTGRLCLWTCIRAEPRVVLVSIFTGFHLPEEPKSETSGLVWTLMASHKRHMKTMSTSFSNSSCPPTLTREFQKRLLRQIILSLTELIFQDLPLLPTTHWRKSLVQLQTMPTSHTSSTMPPSNCCGRAPTSSPAPRWKKLLERSHLT